MTNTPLIVNYACGATAATVGDFLLPGGVQLEPNTTLVYAVLRVVLGGINQDKNNSARLWFATSITSYPDLTTACRANRYNARYVDLPLRSANFTGNSSNLYLERKSDAELTVGLGYVYFWIEIPNMSAVMTVNANLIQMP